MVDTQGVLPAARNLEVRGQGVDRTGTSQRRLLRLHGGRNIEAVEVIQRRQLQRCEYGSRAGGTRDALAGQHDTVVAEAVADPDVRRTTTEQADAAVNLRVLTPVPLEADTRADELATIQRIVAVEAVAAQEARVRTRRIAGGETFSAHAVRDEQVFRGLPTVLQVQGSVGEAKESCGVIRVVRVRQHRVGVAERSRAAVGEVCEVVEDVRTLRVLHEDIEHVERLALEAGRQGVVAEQVVRLELPLLRLVAQLVGVARDIRADDHGAAISKPVDGHLREGVATQRLLAVRHLLLGILEFGREGVGPSGEHLHHLLVELVTTLVPLRGRNERTAGGASAVARNVEVLGALVAVAHAVVVVDVPVKVHQHLLALLGNGVRDSESVEVVGGLGSGDDRVVFRLRRGHQLGGQAGAGRPDVHRRGTLELLVVSEEEQLVLDDRAADGGAVALLFEGEPDALVRRQPGAVLGLGTGHAVVVVVVVRRAVEVVGAGLRDDVDGATLEARVLRIVGRGEHRQALHRIQRDGRAVGGIARTVQAEVVVLLHAVDGEAVEAVVLAGDGDGVAVLRVEIDGRVVADHVLQVAVDAGRVGNLAGREGRRDTELRFAFTRRGHFHFADHFRRLQRNAE